jgi:alkylation response protein AidB-like acyl-CoA dehydrogenase
MRRPDVEVRPIASLTGTGEFNEVFFDGARIGAGDTTRRAGDGWRVAMATLGYERGASTLCRQIGFRRELDRVIERVRAGGAAADPILRGRLAQAWTELEVMRFNALRTMRSPAAGEPGPEASIAKFFWSSGIAGSANWPWTCRGPRGWSRPAPNPTSRPMPSGCCCSAGRTRSTRGSSEIQRIIIAERSLGLPRS